MLLDILGGFLELIATVIGFAVALVLGAVATLLLVVFAAILPGVKAKKIKDNDDDAS